MCVCVCVFSRSGVWLLDAEAPVYVWEHHQSSRARWTHPEHLVQTTGDRTQGALWGEATVTLTAGVHKTWSCMNTIHVKQTIKNLIDLNGLVLELQWAKYKTFAKLWFDSVLLHLNYSLYASMIHLLVKSWMMVIIGWMHSNTTMERIKQTKYIIIYFSAFDWFKANQYVITGNWTMLHLFWLFIGSLYICIRIVLLVMFMFLLPALTKNVKVFTVTCNI